MVVHSPPCCVVESDHQTGFYIAIFSQSLAILCSRQSWDPKARQVLTVVAVCLLFALSTIYLAVDIANAFPYPVSCYFVSNSIIAM